ncbi:MAG: beta-L-arabinofuranosidase domain-containing protein, partial [Candidatus Hydrogenedentales bacterium]
AAGMICFTQLNEGLVMLANATGDSRYLDACKSIQTWFHSDRGKQHTHGYLTTLRGFAMQYEATHDESLLALIEELYASLVASPELMLYGGVKEFFGDEKYDKDEGCSEADFLRLSLQLWRITGKSDYVDRAEHILRNQFYSNEFATGDFGHHSYFDKGLTTSAGQGRAWWCCTMHGLRAFRDVLDAVITADATAVRVNLFDSVRWSDGTRGITTDSERAKSRGALRIHVDKSPAQGISLAVRIPKWIANEGIFKGEVALSNHRDGDYLYLNDPLTQGADIELRFDYRVELIKRDGTRIDPSQLAKEPIEAVVQYGPWLLGVDEHFDPLYLSEPWMDNVVIFPANVSIPEESAESPMSINGAHVRCDYVHGGYPDVQKVTLRPLSERTLHEPRAFITWLKVRAEE